MLGERPLNGLAVPERDESQLRCNAKHAHYSGERTSRRSRNLELIIDCDRC